MIETGAYGERMAGYLHLAGPTIHTTMGSGRSEIAVTRLHAPSGFSDPTSRIRARVCLRGPRAGK